MDAKNSNHKPRSEMLQEIEERLDQANYAELEIVHRIVRSYIKLTAAQGV